MNLFNKTIAGLTAIALTVSGVLPVANVAQAAGWQQNAFDRNADLMPRVTNAASVSALEKLSTREEAIAFISRFIENYDFGLTYDASMNCDYTDAANIMSDLTDEVMAACEAGIIKSAVTNPMVNAKALVTEGQFATMLARLVTGDPTMEVGDANAFLSDVNVMGQYAYTTYKGDNNLTKILALEMLRKLALALEEPTTVDCTMDPTMPECLSGTTGTMNTGTVVEVKAGNLDLTLGAGSPANGSSIPMNGVVTFAKVALAAGSSDVNVRSVTLRREGLGERTDFSRVYFEQNGVRISSRSSLTTDGMVTLSFTPALVVKANGTEVVDLVASLASSQAGSEHRFVVTAVDSSAVNATFSVTTPTLRTANYTVGAVTFTTGGVDTTIQGSETNYEIGRFRLDNVSNNDKVVKVKAITFRNAGDGDLTEGLMDIALFKNSTKVSNNVIINGREITFVLDNTELNASESSLFYIKANTKAVDSTAGDKYQFEIRNSEDLNAVESVTDFRVSVNGIPSTTALAEYTVKGGDLMITRDTSVATTNTVSPGQNGVILAKGTITARQPSNLEDLVTSITSSAALSGLVQKLTLRIGSSSATFTPASTAGAGPNPVTFDGSFSVNGTTPFEITADLRASFSGNATMQLAAVQLTQFSIREYLNGNQIQTNELIGTLSTVNVNVQKSVLNASRNDALSDRSVVRGSNELVIFGANLSTSTNSPITVNSLDLVAAGVTSGALYNNKLTLSLYVDGVLRSTRQYNGGTVTFSSLSVPVTKTSSVNVQVKANINNDVTLDNSTFQFALQNINATDGNSQTVTPPSTVNSVVFTVVGAGKTNVTSNSSVTDQGFAVATTTKKVGSFAVQAINDNLEIRGAYIMLSGLNGYTNAGNAVTSFVIKNAAGTVVAQESSRSGVNNEVVKFENFVAGTTITAGNSATYSVYAVVSNLNGASDAGEFVAKMDTSYTDAAYSGQIFNGVRLFSVNAGDYVTTGTVTTANIGNVLNVVSAYPTVAHVANGNTTDLLTFKITNAGTTNLVVSGVQYFANAQNSADINGAAFTLYNGSTVVATGTLVAGANTMVSFNSTISVAATDNLVLTMKLDAPFSNTALNPTAGNRVFQISNLDYAQQFANGTESAFGQVATAYLTTVGLPVAAANF